MAIATGEPSGTWVMDVDDLGGAGRTGSEARHRCRSRQPPRREAGDGTTSSPGRRRARASRMRSSSADALDIRTTGGYVLAPPSVHASGNAYRWLVSPDDAPLAEAPAWLVDLVAEARHDDYDRRQRERGRARAAVP